MTLPDFLVLGAQKAGSTWVYDCLKQHPDVFMPKAVELLYFNKPNYADLKLRNAYAAHFDRADGFARIGEKTPGYFWSTDRERSLTQPPAGHNADVPNAVRDVLGGDVDFIVSLRHPVWRAISAFSHHAKRDRIDPKKTLQEVAHQLGILDIGFYGAHLDSWFKTVDPACFEVLIFEDDIVADPLAGFRKLCRFLKVDEDVRPACLFETSNPSDARLVDPTGITVKGHPLRIGPDDIEYLIDAYAADILRTKTILDNDLTSWDAETARLRSWCESARRTLHQRAATVSPLNCPDPSIVRNRQMRSFGLQATPQVTDGLDRRFVFEAPARLSDLKVRGDCSIGAFSYAVSGHAYGTHIGRYCSIARDVNIGQFNHTMEWLSTSPFQFEQGFTFATGDDFPDKEAYDATAPDPKLSARARRDLTKVTTIGNDVWLGHGAIITAGVTIGDDAVIGANAVVTKDVEPYAIMGGVPAKMIRYRFDAAMRKRLMKTQWWQYATWQLEGVPFADLEDALTEIERRVAEENMQPYVPSKVVQTVHGPAFQT
jgi:acetyltransferase-like isoleucine patch superfamily enzyme